MYRLEAVTVNGDKVGYSQLGGSFYRDVAPGHYVVAAPRFQDVDESQSAKIDLAADRRYT